MNHFQAQTHPYNQGIMQQQYNEAINKASNDNKAHFEKELEIKTAELKKKYVDLIQLEQDQVGKKYVPEHKIKVMKLRENIQQSHSRDADETLHNAKQECNNEEQKLEALITSEYVNQIAVAKKELNKLRSF